MKRAVISFARRLAGGALLVLGLGAFAGAAIAGGGVALAIDGAGRTLFKAGPEFVARSGDGGQHWAAVKLPPLAASARIASVAVAAGGALYVAGPGLGVLRSDDGGEHWSTRSAGLPGADVAAIATHAEQPETVFAYVTGNGFFRSQDGGGRWQLMDAGPRGGIVRFMHSNMPGSMQTGWLFAATGQGVRRAMDCFCGWRDAGELARPVTAVAYDPREPRTVYAATGDGVFRSADGGEQWSRAGVPAAVPRALVVTPDGVVYAATDDGALFRSRDGARTWERVGA